MTVTEHLSELRRRLVWSLLVTAAVGVLLAFRWRTLLEKALFPLIFAKSGHLTWTGWKQAWEGSRSVRSALTTLSPTEPLFTLVGLILAVSVVFSSPLWVYQVWAYFSPVLPFRHRRWAGLYLVAGLVLFWLGASASFFVILPVSLHFLLTFSQGLFSEQVRASAYLSFVTGFSLAFGAVSALPAMLAATVKLGIWRADHLKKGRRMALFVSAVLSAVVVPSPDPLTLLAAMVPVYGLYEGTVLLARFIRPISG